MNVFSSKGKVHGAAIGKVIGCAGTHRHVPTWATALLITDVRNSLVAC